MSGMNTFKPIFVPILTFLCHISKVQSVQQNNLEPKIIFPTECQSIILPSNLDKNDHSITIKAQVPRSFASKSTHNNNDATKYHWVAYLQSDKEIWDYDVPPTPFHTTTIVSNPSIDPSTNNGAENQSPNTNATDLQLQLIQFTFDATSFINDVYFHKLTLRLVDKNTFELCPFVLSNTVTLFFSTIYDVQDNSNYNELKAHNNQLQTVIHELKQQDKIVAQRRMERFNEIEVNYTKIAEKYQHLQKNSELYDVNNWFTKYLNPKYQISKYNTSTNVLTNDMSHITNQDKVFENLIELIDASNGLYKFKYPLFTQEFIELMLDELKHASMLQLNGTIELNRPNSMNRIGFVLKEMGFEQTLNQFFLTKTIDEVQNDESQRRSLFDVFVSHLYPFYLFGGDWLDNLHAFSIQYNGDDSSLSRHMDESEITLNICLKNDDRQNSNVFFNGIRDYHDDEGNYINNDKNEQVVVDLNQGEAILHVGQAWHGANTIQHGERINLIFWFRSFAKNRRSVTSQMLDRCFTSTTRNNAKSEL